MSKITVQDINGAWKRYVTALQKHGVDVSTYAMQTGTGVTSWRAHVIGEHGGASAGAGGDFLGDTRAEAYRSLINRAQVLEDLQHFQKFGV